jgi:hypothetical protein
VRGWDLHLGQVPAVVFTGRPFIFVVIGRKLAGTAGYHEPPAKDASQRIVAFFNARLTP